MAHKRGNLSFSLDKGMGCVYTIAKCYRLESYEILNRRYKEGYKNRLRSSVWDEIVDEEPIRNQNDA